MEQPVTSLIHAHTQQHDPINSYNSNMESAKQILSELNGRIQAGDVDGGVATLSKMKVSVVCLALVTVSLSPYTVCIVTV
jgi:hypothetical protein